MALTRKASKNNEEELIEMMTRMKAEITELQSELEKSR